jgi:hypothetical protein
MIINLIEHNASLIETPANECRADIRASHIKIYINTNAIIYSKIWMNLVEDYCSLIETPANKCRYHGLSFPFIIFPNFHKFLYQPRCDCICTPYNTNMYIYGELSVYIYVYILIHTYIYVYICIYRYTYVHLYIHILVSI